MIEPVETPWLVPFDGSFRVAEAPTAPPEEWEGKKSSKKALKKRIEELEALQQVLYAEDKHAVLLVFQAMDAAGKDGTIRAILSGINPAGCQVFAFKQPSAMELDHDFLWRTAQHLPERGRIGVFNRSYYEEVVAVRVHPEWLDGQKLPDRVKGHALWEDRYTSIRDHERHLAVNGTVILKFWLNVSKDEQKARFLARIEDPDKNWKFSLSDIRERRLWDDYMEAFEEALNETSRPWAPWYAIPGDSKPFMREAVADVVVRTLRQLDFRYPEPDEATMARLEEMRKELEAE
ncbi:MAG TPA: PPK2 family polyphosphate kinase [Gemmatimonadota bacterium]|nr:PPK2 family polyphosphate kinase [Gemmatimonadota bacterium]